MWDSKLSNGTASPVQTLKHYMPSILWAAFVLWLSLSPQRGFPKWDIPYLDKFVHFIFYFIFVVLLYYGWTKQYTTLFIRTSNLVAILFTASVYGLTIELLQEWFTTDRHFSWFDEAANVTGGLSGLIAMRLIYRIRDEF